MSVDTNNTELKKGADLATIADQRDDQRQQAEAEAAQEVLQRMQDTAAEDEKRRAHEEAEAKRKAEWEQKQREKAEAEQAAWENAVAMGDDEVMMASMKRVGDDAERLTRRNMKQCVTEHIQTKCLSEPEFARQVMHPRKNMIRCFRYIVLFPNDLKAEHDRVNDMSRNDVSQAYDRRIAKMFEGLQHRYGYTQMGFVVIPPHSAKEITQEGDKLHHCVGRYVKDVVKNNTTILFIRKASAPKKPYCTVEVKHGDVIQARIQNNVVPPPKVKRFIESWKENVLYAPALERAA